MYDTSNDLVNYGKDNRIDKPKIRQEKLKDRLRTKIRSNYGQDMKEKLDYPTDIYCDNVITIQLVQTGTVSNRTNYLSQDACLVNQYIKDRICDAKKIDTEWNLADIFTKPGTGAIMEKLSGFLLQDVGTFISNEPEVVYETRV